MKSLQYFVFCCMFNSPAAMFHRINFRQQTLISNIPRSQCGEMRNDRSVHGHSPNVASVAVPRSESVPMQSRTHRSQRLR